MIAIVKIALATTLVNIAAGAALATTITGIVTVNASTNSVSGGVPASSGQTLAPGSAFSVAGGVGTWNFGPSFQTNANGCCFDVALFGKVFKAGSLVGRVGNEAWFLVGTAGYAGTTLAGGTLGFGMWDGDFANNFGNLTVEYMVPGGDPAVPEPATWAFMIAGFGLVGAAMRRRRALPVPIFATRR